MLLLTDLSGPSVVKGFESYLTGYPLPDEGGYAFSRTWYAEEMSRPGCVWTHTLLLSGEILASLSDLSALNQLFSRPAKTDIAGDFAAYQAHVAVDVELNAPSLTFEAIEEQVRFLIGALYGQPKASVVIGARREVDLELAVLAIWSQQWPRLRRYFTFCTGSLGRRSSADIGFDLQIVPEAHVRQFRRDAHPSVVIADEAVKEDRDRIDWVHATLNDMISGSHGRLHDFLWEFGGDHQDGRTTFSRLVEIFNYLEQLRSGSGQLADLIESVARYFPEPTNGVRLKTALFGSRFDRQERLLPQTNEIELLRELVKTPHHAAFDPEVLGIQIRSDSILKSDREDTMRVILQLCGSELNPMGEELIKGISRNLDAGDLADVVKTTPDLLYLFVEYNPSLAASPELWRGSIGHQRRLVDAIAGGLNKIPDYLVDETLRLMVAAMIDCKANSIAEEVIERLGPQAVDAVVEWVDNWVKSPSDIPYEWRRALASKPGSLLKWLQGAAAARDLTIALIITLLDPDSPEVYSFDTRMWPRLLATIGSANLDHKTYVHAMAVLLALGFNKSESGGVNLIALTFEVVHDAAESGELDYDGWRLFKDRLPPLSWWRDWDKCERLRRGLVDRYIHYGWPVDQFLQSVKRQETLCRIVDFCETTSSGREFLQKVIEEINLGKARATDSQRAVLTRGHR